MSEQFVHPLSDREAVLLYGLLTDFEKSAGLNNLYLRLQQFLIDSDIDLTLSEYCIEYKVLNSDAAILLPIESVLAKLGV